MKEDDQQPSPAGEFRGNTILLTSKIDCAWFSIYSPNYAFSTSILMLKTSIFDPVP